MSKVPKLQREWRTVRRRVLDALSELARFADGLERAGTPNEIVDGLREFVYADEEFEVRMRKAKGYLDK